ncbi:hypothetical protein ACQ33O_04560 [Ferruginibacter sp. SUN002]|uniref:hypothetical protein n=1 Tax=Ferruginibacter sp. SUN002 TaxID=2937789 RepID=UPI003D35F41C
MSKEDTETIASAFEDRLDSFFYSGRKYDLKEIQEFRVFAYDHPDDYHTKINASQEALKEGYFAGEYVFFKPHTLAKLFNDVTNDFIRKFAAERKQAVTVEYPYVNKIRIDDLRSINNSSFDLKRVIKLCDEINHTFSDRCFIATIILVRALLDHIPPIFSKKSFSEVANNYGPKSFKDTMHTLDNSSRKIADLYLHTHISNKEDTPLEQQVNYSQAIDLLLSEIVKLLK